MEKYVFDLQSGDVILVSGERVIIDCFVPINESLVCVDGYFEDSGEAFSPMYDYNDIVTVVR